MEVRIVRGGIGLVTSLGVGATPTCAAYHAGIARMEVSAILDRRLEPIVMGLVPEDDVPPLEDGLASRANLTTRVRRFVRLAAPAVQEAMEALPEIAAPVPILLGVMEEAPPAARSMPPNTATRPDLIELLECQSKVKFDRARSRIFPKGRAAGLIALGMAVDMVTREDVPYALAVGVDSYLDLRVLGNLETEGRLKAGANMDGFIPGEGAGAILVGRATETTGADGILVLSVANGLEGGHIYSEEPYRGEGLARTIADCLEKAAPSVPMIRTVFAGFNGESYWGKGWGVAQIRNSASFDPDGKIFHPADSMGDTGAAMGPIMTGIASWMLENGLCSGPALVWSASDRGDQAAAIIRHAGGE